METENGNYDSMMCDWRDKVKIWECEVDVRVSSEEKRGYLRGRVTRPLPSASRVLFNYFGTHIT